MLNDLTIFVNTHTSASDAWPVFFGQLKKCWPDLSPWLPRLSIERRVIALNGDPNVKRFYSMCMPDAADRFAGLRNIGPATFIDYGFANTFSTQYLMGLCAVGTKYVLTLQEDMFLYGRVDEAYLKGVVEYLDCEEHVDSVRLIESGKDQLYSMQASIWRTQSLRELYASANYKTPWDAEIGLSQSERYTSGRRTSTIINGDGPRRGNHRDSTQFPYVATALVRGKWNAQYRAELEPMLAEYGVNPSKRGWTE